MSSGSFLSILLISGTSYPTVVYFFNFHHFLHLLRFYTKVFTTNITNPLNYGSLEKFKLWTILNSIKPTTRRTIIQSKRKIVEYLYL